MEDNTRIVYRTEKHRISKQHPLYKLFDDLCFKSKNLYNLSLYTQRQYYFQNNKFLSYTELVKYLKNTEAFKDLPCTLSQQTVKKTTEACQSFLKASKDYSINPGKYLGKPKLPQYKHKTKGRFPLIFTYLACRIKDGQVHFHKILPKEFTLPTKIEELVQVQIVPKGSDYWIYVTGTKTIQLNQHSDLKYSAGIDLGIDNFSTITVWNNDTRPLIIDGKGLKSYNKQFNKELAKLKSEAMKNNKTYMTKRIQALYQKRDRYIDSWMHKASRMTVNYLVQHKAKYITIGNNQGWKQNSPLSKKVNQTFVQIPYQKYIDQVVYKAQDEGIKVYTTEESYTSGTSFLDNEPPISSYYNKTRRKHRGQFISNEDYSINADVNASYQIQKKAFPGLKADFTEFTKEQLHNKTHPIKVMVS